MMNKFLFKIYVKTKAELELALVFIFNSHTFSTMVVAQLSEKREARERPGPG